MKSQLRILNKYESKYQITLWLSTESSFDIEKSKNRKIMMDLIIILYENIMCQFEGSSLHRWDDGYLDERFSMNDALVKFNFLEIVI